MLHCKEVCEGQNSRHESGHDALEDKGNRSKQTAKICSDPRAEGENAGQQSTACEEEGDEHESEHEPGHVEIVSRADEVFWDVNRGIEVAARGRIEWSSWSNAAVSMPAAIIAT